MVDAEDARAGCASAGTSAEPTDERARRDPARDARATWTPSCELVRSRREALEELEDELIGKRRRMRELLAELEAGAA